MEKAEVLPKDIKWHFIGGLQSSKSEFFLYFFILTFGFVFVRSSICPWIFSGVLRACGSSRGHDF